MPKRKRPLHERAEHLIQFRVTEQEFAELQMAADLDMRTVSQFARRAAVLAARRMLADDQTDR